MNYFIFCNISKSEVSYFENFIKQSDNPMFYYFLCGGKFTTKTITYILDKRRFPIFRIKKFFFPKSKTVNFDDKLKINADIEGNITNYKKGNKFYIFTNIEKYNINTTYMMECF